jgi:arginine/ornithine N-succinyltransferase beta subunit
MSISSVLPVIGFVEQPATNANAETINDMVRYLLITAPRQVFEKIMFEELYGIDYKGLFAVWKQKV